MTTTTDVDVILSRLIRDISVISDEDLILISRVMERAYTHILVEQALRPSVRRVDPA